MLVDVSTVINYERLPEVNLHSSCLSSGRNEPSKKKHSEKFTIESRRKHFARSMESGIKRGNR
jgi:hypothetical protein